MNELAAPDSVAAVVAGIVDPDAAVRWRTIRLLSFIGESLLRSSISHIAAPELKSAISALVLPYADFNSARIVDQLRSSGPLQRRVALAAAIRVRHVSPEALRFAAAQGDQEVREIASEFLVEWSRVDKESSDA
jgi:hypothetical protein